MKKIILLCAAVAMLGSGTARATPERPLGPAAWVVQEYKTQLTPSVQEALDKWGFAGFAVKNIDFTNLDGLPQSDGITYGFHPVEWRAEIWVNGQWATLSGELRAKFHTDFTSSPIVEAGEPRFKEMDDQAKDVLVKGAKVKTPANIDDALRQVKVSNQADGFEGEHLFHVGTNIEAQTLTIRTEVKRTLGDRFRGQVRRFDRDVKVPVQNSSHAPVTFKK